MLVEVPLSRTERGTFLAQVELFPVGKGTHCTSTTSSKRDSISATPFSATAALVTAAAWDANNCKRKMHRFQEEWCYVLLFTDTAGGAFNSRRKRHCLLQEWYFAAGNAIKQRRKRCHLQQEQNFFQVLEAKNHSISSSITNKRKGHHLVKYWWQYSHQEK